jgi:hypothetical protein
MFSTLTDPVFPSRIAWLVSMQLAVLICFICIFLTVGASKARGKREEHPYSVNLVPKQRAWNAIYNPHLERNFCCCYCTTDETQGSYDEESEVLGGLAGSFYASDSEPVQVDSGYRQGPWLVREDQENACGYEYCRVMFPSTCRDSRSTIYAGATGYHDPYRKFQAWKARRRRGDVEAQNQDPGSLLALSLTEVVGQCQQVRQEGGSWWQAFQELGPQ